MKQILENIIGSYRHFPYTWKHYLAFLKVEKKLLGRYKYKFHDWDKLVLFIFCPFLGERRINQLHQKLCSHHPTYTTGRNWKKHFKSPKNIDFLQAVIDWECARYTKPDKPLNARETMEKYYPEYRKHVELILEELGL